MPIREEKQIPTGSAVLKLHYVHLYVCELKNSG